MGDITSESKRHTCKIITEKFWKGELLFDAVGGSGRRCGGVQEPGKISLKE